MKLYRNLLRITIISVCCSILNACYVSKLYYTTTRSYSLTIEDSLFNINGEIFGDKKDLSLGIGFVKHINYSIIQFDVKIILSKNDTLMYNNIRTSYFKDSYLDAFNYYNSFEATPQSARVTTFKDKQNYFTLSFKDPKKQIRDSVIYALIKAKLLKNSEVLYVNEVIKLYRSKSWYWTM